VNDEEPSSRRIADEDVAGVVGRDAVGAARGGDATGDAETAPLADLHHGEVPGAVTQTSPVAPTH
jgi:hypothetical protein